MIGGGMVLFMLSEQKSSVEIVAYPYNRLTTLYFLLRFPQRFLAAGNKKRDFWSFSALLFSTPKIGVFFSF
jgi:hypothetical protein